MQILIQKEIPNKRFARDDFPAPATPNITILGLGYSSHLTKITIN